MPKDNTKTNNRPDKLEFERRLTTILSWVYDGAPSTLIIQNIEKKEWAKGERNAYKLLKKAKEQMVRYDDDTLEQKRRQKVQELKMRIRTLKPEFAGTPAGLRVILQYEKLISDIEGTSIHYRPKEDDVPPPPVTPAFIQPVDLSLSADEIKLFDNELEDEY